MRGASPGTPTDSGQAMVETALVLPLYVFLLLGTMQLGLMHQARLLTKYAAFKAVRAGALHNGRVDLMEKAAEAALLPVISHRLSSGDIERIIPIKDAASFKSKWMWDEVQNNKMGDADFKLVEVTICGPIRNELGAATEGEMDFDDPATGSGTDWEESERTKLRIQVTLNYRMPIPFANWVIHAIARNAEIPAVLRLHKGNKTNIESRYSDAGVAGLYILPIRAEYTERMQSNLYVNKAPIPEENKCVFPFGY